MKRRNLLKAAVGVGLPSVAFSQDKPVRILVGFPPGTSLDIMARQLAETLRGRLGRPVVVDNRPGAGGQIAASALKSAAPDGDTLMVAPLFVSVLAPLVISRLPYNPDTDFVPVGHICDFQFGLAVRADMPVQSVRAFVDWLRANQAKANYGTQGAGSLPHFFGQMLAREANLEFIHSPFLGGTLQTSVVGGHVTAAIDTVFDLQELHRSGKLKVLATSGSRRSRTLPEVPTFAESGFPAVVGEAWFGAYAPAGTPAGVIESLNAALNMTLATPLVREQFGRLGLDAGGGTPQHLSDLHVRDRRRWEPVIRATGFRVS